MTKQDWLDIAEVIDAHRVIPKLILVAAFTGYGVLTYDSYLWVKSIYETTGDVPIAVAAFAGGVVSSLGGVLTLLVNKYFGGGRKWDGVTHE